MASQDLTYEELYNDLVASARQELPDGAFTLTQFREDSGISDYSARKTLKARVEAGELATEKMIVNGKRQNVYWFL